ncbi:PREDICTED: sodium/bile acid cotransporter 7-like isoform X2 [Priapulus caudatus]|uniref:Sodium/bile acid cotransporter 7-like isoform X2 n=1 Tax=Priapulus caudatus TaxID=37621 RepID=A0ABM1E2Q5_PRICU|nr:PREDICTED: sodium/bile acid cotransporter 7-like isoform X2 [Priapulus caudatus]
MSFIDKLRANWFLLGIIIVIVSAKFNPEIGKKGGILKPEVTVKYVAVSVIFFNSGLSLKTEELMKALFNGKLHIFVQCFTLMFIPCFMQAIVAALQLSSINNWLLKGLLVVGCMPPPVSSAVILTKAVGGSEASAIFNSAFGSFLVGVSTEVPVVAIFSTLAMTVVVPLLLGQLVRWCIRDWIQRASIPFGPIGSAILLYIIYTTFCDTFSHGEGLLSMGDILPIGITVFCIQVVLLSLTFLLCTRGPVAFSPADIVAAMFCATHKSLTLGIPMLKIIYHGDPHLSLISLPLLIYHPTQILLGSSLVPSIRKWMLRAQHRKSTLSGI